jgi:hypothetical protein
MTVFLVFMARSIWRRITDPFDVDSLADMLSDNKPIKQKLPDIVQFLKIWRGKATGLRILHASLGASSVFFSLLTTTVLQFHSDDQWNTYAKIFAFIAALSIGLLTAFNLGTKSNDMTNAWRKLTAAVMRFNCGLIKEEDVIKAYIEAESLIGDVTFDQSAQPHPDTRRTEIDEHNPPQPDTGHNETDGNNASRQP